MEDQNRKRVNIIFNPQPEIGKFLGFDHITIYVGNALQSSSYYVTRMAFSPFAYQVSLILYSIKRKKNYSKKKQKNK